MPPKPDEIIITNPGSGYSTTEKEQEFIYNLIALYGGGDYRKDKSNSPIDNIDKYLAGIKQEN